MKILTIFTGGTIGSSVTDGFIAPDKASKYKLIDMYKRSEKALDAEFVVEEPFSMLSENSTGKTLAKLGAFIEKAAAKTDDISGIIITHGSDTLQYTGAFLKLYLKKLTVPVLLVASNRVLDDPTANGLSNFTAAVDFIRLFNTFSYPATCYIPYRNSDDLTYIHRGDLTLPQLPYSDDLFSVSKTHVGYMTAGHEFISNDRYQTQLIYDAKLDELLPLENVYLPDTWDSKILRIYPFPGMSYPSIDVNSEIRAVLLDTYHSGTLCSVTPRMSEFMNRCFELGIPVYLTGANTDTDYESVKAWKEMHITVLPQASPISVYMRLWLTLSV